MKLKDYLKQLSDEGKDIRITWDGGNDSGSYYAYIGGKELSYGTHLEEILTRIADDHLDYGSWAGDFYASGEVCYNPRSGEFEGDSRTSVSESATTVSDIEIVVPEAINFDSISIDLEGNSEDGVSCSFKLNVMNGPVFEEHRDIEREVEDQVKERVCTILDKVCFDKERYSVYDSDSISRDEMELVVKNGVRSLVHKIESISFYYDIREEDMITFEISDDLEIDHENLY